MSSQVYQFQSPDSYMSFYTMDGLYPQLINTTINATTANNSSTSSNIDDNSKTLANNILSASSLGADDFRKVAIPERNKVKSVDKPKSSLTMLLESRPENPNICDDNNNNNSNNYSLEYNDNNSHHIVSSLPTVFTDIDYSNNNNSNNNGNLNSNMNSNTNDHVEHDDERDSITGNISFTDLIQLVTEEERNVSKSQCEIYPTEEDGSVIDYLPDISKNQNILDFGLQDFVVVDKVSSKTLMHVHIGINSTPSPSLELSSKNSMPIPSNPSPAPVNDNNAHSVASDSSSKDPNLSYYERFANNRVRAASESCAGPITIYFKKAGSNNWSIAGKNVTQLSSSTTSSTPTSVSSYHVRGAQKLMNSYVAKSLPEERLDSSLYSPARSSFGFINNSSNNNSNSNIYDNSNSYDKNKTVTLPKMEMMKSGPFAYCHNMSSSDSSDSDDDDDDNIGGTWGRSRQK